MLWKIFGMVKVTFTGSNADMCIGHINNISRIGKIKASILSTKCTKGSRSKSKKLAFKYWEKQQNQSPSHDIEKLFPKK